MTLINDTYFKKRLTAIPSLNQPPISTKLNNYLDIYEDEYLVNVLGQQLSDEFAAGLEESVVDPKWTALRDGAEFTYNNVKYNWKGFLRTTKESPIANYIMWYIVRDGNDDLTGVGVMKSTSENSEVQSPINRMVNIWNQMVKENRILSLFLLSNQSDYPSYKLFNGSENCDVLTTKQNIYGI